MMAYPEHFSTGLKRYKFFYTIAKKGIFALLFALKFV